VCDDFSNFNDVASGPVVYLASTETPETLEASISDLLSGERNASGPSQRYRWSWFEKTQDQEKPSIQDLIEYSDATSPQPLFFLYPGQGSQYPGMAEWLYGSVPFFRSTLREILEQLPITQSDHLIRLMVEREDVGEQQSSTLHTQPLLFAFELALTRLWARWGVYPDGVIGQSFGEYPAACVASVFSQEDGLRLVTERARLMNALPSGGAYATLGVNQERAEAWIAPHSDAISVAGILAPDQIVISGCHLAVNTILEQCANERIPFKRIPVSHAFHSPLMDPMLDDFEAFCRDFIFDVPKIHWISTLHNVDLSREKAVEPDYWRRQVREPVLMLDSFQTAFKMCPTTFLEMGPGNTFKPFSRRIEGHASHTWLSSLDRRRPAWEVLMAAAVHLWRLGYPINMSLIAADLGLVIRECHSPSTHH
jgi:myxalamid-type polyketide synthase MxaC